MALLCHFCYSHISLNEHLSAISVLLQVRVTQSLIFKCFLYCLFFLVIVLSVLFRFTASDNPFWYFQTFAKPDLGNWRLHLLKELLYQFQTEYTCKMQITYSKMCIYILRVSVDHINITSRHFDGCIRAAVTSPYRREMFTVLTGNQQQNKCVCLLNQPC